jgi:hypothetical protein
MRCEVLCKAFAALVAIVPSTQAAECTRDGLLAAAQSYVTAQTTGKIDGLKLSSNFTYQQNNKISTLSTSLLNTPYKIDLNRSTADTVACASYTMWISSSGSKPYIVSTQIRHIDNNTSEIAMIDTVAATTGDLFFNAKDTLKYIKAEDWTSLPASSRPSRELLRKVGDAYLDMWTDAKAADTIPWGTVCERVEGSKYSTCAGSLPRGGSAKKNGNRRYVIDEETGSVDVLCEFSSLGAWPDSHEVRVQDGKVRYVHTVTVMKT